MYSLFFSLFRILTWWAYLGLAAMVGTLTYNGYQIYAAKQVAAEQGIRAGLPPQIGVGSFDPYTVQNPLDEAHLRGVIRADLGVGAHR